MSDITAKIVKAVRDYKGNAPFDAIEARTGLDEKRLESYVDKKSFLKVNHDNNTIQIVESAADKGPF